MKLFNLRFGFATNSSSSHSLAFPGNHLEDRDCESGEFGWNEFIAASDDMKLLYVATLADGVLSRSIPDPSSRQALIRHLLGNERIQTYFREGDFDEQGYIDHQSTYVLPIDWGNEFIVGCSGKFINIEFLRDFVNYFLQDGLVILGGNDNWDPDEDGTSLREQYNGFNLPIPQDYNSGEWVARKDPQYNYWTMFSRRDGTKVRFSFDNINAPTPERAFAPELLDIKITNRCPFSANTGRMACSRYCYQNSQLIGNELNHSIFYPLASNLRQLQVFEVAFGGGEPTCHPRFVSLLETFRREGIVPNFSTRNLSWLRDASLWPSIIDNCGAFAYSVRNAREVETLYKLIRNKISEHERTNLVSVQVIMGTLDRRTFKNILTKAGERNIKVTLLGYKNIGRGLEFTPFNYNWWIPVINEMREDANIRVPSISIDTTLAEQFEEEIIAENIPRWMFHTQEGRFSGYLDAVQGKFGPSSFCRDTEMFDLNEEGRRNRIDWVNNLKEKIITIYPKFQ